MQSMGAGRPPKPNDLKKALGSRHVEAEAPPQHNVPLIDPKIPPVILNENAQRAWNQFIPKLAELGKVHEHNRAILCVWCRELSIYFFDGDIDARERRLCAESIIDIGGQLGLTPLSGMKLGTNGNAQPAPVDSRQR